MVDAEATAAEEAAGSEEMSKLLDQYDEQQEEAAKNEIIEVKVVAYTEHGVVVDIGQKTEGLIPAAEFSETEIPRPEPNSHHRSAAHRRAQRRLRDRLVPESSAPPYLGKDRSGIQGQRDGSGKVVDRIKGGLVVDIGVRAFLPGSQYDLRPTANLDNLMGQEVQVRITKLNRRRGNVVVSRRAMLEEEQHAKRAELMETLHEGDSSRVS